jgi:hypothetical protein
MNEINKKKYIKYKTKYLKLKEFQMGGGEGYDEDKGYEGSAYSSGIITYINNEPKNTLVFNSESIVNEISKLLEIISNFLTNIPNEEKLDYLIRNIDEIKIKYTNIQRIISMILRAQSGAYMTIYYKNYTKRIPYGNYNEPPENYEMYKVNKYKVEQPIYVKQIQYIETLLNIVNIIFDIQLHKLTSLNLETIITYFQKEDFGFQKFLKQLRETNEVFRGILKADPTGGNRKGTNDTKLKTQLINALNDTQTQNYIRYYKSGWISMEGYETEQDLTEWQLNSRMKEELYKFIEQGGLYDKMIIQLAETYRIEANKEANATRTSQKVGTSYISRGVESILSMKKKLIGSNESSYTPLEEQDTGMEGPYTHTGKLDDTGIGKQDTARI